MTSSCTYTARFCSYVHVFFCVYIVEQHFMYLCGCDFIYVVLFFSHLKAKGDEVNDEVLEPVNTHFLFKVSIKSGFSGERYKPELCSFKST